MPATEEDAANAKKDMVRRIQLAKPICKQVNNGCMAEMTEMAAGCA